MTTEIVTVEQSPEDLENAFLILAKNYFDALASRDNEVHSTCPNLKSQLEAFELPGERKDELLSQVKAEFFHLPESMRISDEAIKKIEQTGQRYEFEFISAPYEEIRYSAPDWVLDLLDDNPDGRVLLCLADRRIVGISNLIEEQAQESVHVQYQQAAINHPGAGLLMLEKIIEEYSGISSFSRITLLTRSLPRGLGNLGFVLSDSQPDPYKDWYNYERPLRDE